MTEMVLPISDGGKFGEDQATERMQITVHIQAEVLAPNQARRRANLWLTMNAGHLLMVKNPELILGESLQWRFDVFLSVPQHDQPGSIRQNQIGAIRLDALTGEVVEPAALIEALQTNASALALH